MTTKGTDNRFRSLTVVGEAGTPATPASGDFKLYVADDGTFYLMDDTGTTAPVGGGLADPMTTRGDIIIRNASNVTARLAKGSSGTYLGSDGTDVAYSAVTDAKLSLSDITTNNASTSNHGFLKKLDNNAAHFMDGTGAWSTPTGSGGSTVGDDVILSGGDITTSSSTFVDLTGASITLSTGAHRCLIGLVAAACDATSDAIVYFDIDVDGTRISGGNVGLTSHQQFQGGAYRTNVSFVAMTTAQLSSGSHTFKAQWRTSSGTATLRAGTSNETVAQFWVTELLS